MIVVDFHAEATSEKVAMGWHLDGRVTAVLGTHTHIPTADERVLPGGTAYLTDVGMSGPYDSVIGVEKELVLHRFLTGMPGKFEPAKGNPKMCAALVAAILKPDAPLGFSGSCSENEQKNRLTCTLRTRSSKAPSSNAPIKRAARFRLPFKIPGFLRYEAESCSVRPFSINQLYGAQLPVLQRGAPELPSSPPG